MKLSPTFVGTFLMLAGIAGTVPRLAHADPAAAMNRERCEGMPPSARSAHGPDSLRPPLAAAPGKGMPLPPILRGIRLTEAQEDSAFALLHRGAPPLREQEKALHKAREALHGLALSGQFDERKARALAESAAKAMAEMELLRARTDSQLLSLLTPEQRRQREEMAGGLDAPPTPK